MTTEKKPKNPLLLCEAYPRHLPAVSRPSTGYAGQTWQHLQTCLQCYHCKACTALLPGIRPKLTSVALERWPGEPVAGF